jgi:hypothetical protein
VSDASTEGSLEQRLTLVLRGVQRMADNLGAIEERLPQFADAAQLRALSDRVDEYRVRSRGEMTQLADVMTTMARAVDVVMREQQALTEAVRGLRSELASLSLPELDQGPLRDDLRRGFDRVLGAVSSAESSVSSEVRALDARVGAMSDDLRVVRVLRDGLTALASDVDSVRQLAAKSATSQQMSDVTRELSAVLREIESARAQVLEVERAPAATVEREVVTVTADVDALGQRIDRLADVVEQRLAEPPAPPPAMIEQPVAGREPDAADELAERLRRMSQSARQLGNGVLEDLRNRRKKPRR